MNQKKYIVASVLSMLSTGCVYASEPPSVIQNTNIYINNVSEDHGLELGTNTRARGTGSIATGKNSVAIGNNAVATGGNETKDSITSKLNENKQKLADIAKAEANTKSLLDELQTIRKQEADVLEAGERVKQVKRAKATAYERYTMAQKKYEDAKAGSADFLKAVQAKIDDLNSRLTAVNKLGGVDINSEQGLTNAATQLKQMVEQGTTLNLDMPFYKTFVKSHYQALGDLRLNNIRNINYYDYEKGYKKEPITGKKITNPYYLNSSYDFKEIYLGACYDYEKGLYFSGRDLNYNIFNQDSTLSNKPTKNIISKNIYTDTSSEQEFIDAKEQAPKFKQSFKEYFAKNDYPLMTPNIKEQLCTEFNKKVDYFVKEIEITYYQKQYEDTGNTTWLDKKNIALQEYNNLAKSYNAKSVMDELRNNYKKWEKENITDIKEKNKITTATLTSELEKALQINKNAALDKEKEIENLKKAAAQALDTYNNTNPSDADIMMSQRYDAIMKELSTKANALKSEQERLQALKEALTLHNLTNVGENAMAMGTNSLATGTDSLAIGTSSVATGNNAVAIGKNASVTSTNSAAVGVDHIITGDTSSTLGYKNTIYGTNSYAIGSMNTIGATSTKKGSNTFVLGNNVTTTANNAVILGADSTATEDNVVSIGADKKERKIIHVADGALSESSTDAVNGKQLYNAMQNAGKTYTAGSHIAISSTNEISVVADGTVADGNTGLVTGGTVYNIVKDKANTSDITNLSTNIDNKLATKANIDASNINVTKFSEKLGVGTVADGNTGLVTGGTVYNIVKDKANTSDITNLSTNIDNKLATKANVDGSNINVTKFREKLGTGLVEEHNYNLVTGDTVFNAIKNLQVNPIATQDIMKNREDINYLKGETSHVGAISAALAGLHPQEFDDDYKFSIAAAQGTYNHANATALGAFYRPNEDLMFSVAGTVSSGNKAYNVGVSYKFGSSTPDKKRQLASENNDLKQRLLVLEKIVNKLMLEDKKETFPDVPSTRWDAEAVETLHANGIIEGYPDGEFKGDQQMTRSEYAQMVYNVLHKK